MTNLKAGKPVDKVNPTGKYNCLIERNPQMLDAERRWAEVYYHQQPRQPIHNPFNTLEMRQMAGYIAPTTRNQDLGRKSGHAQVNLESYEEQLFLSIK